MADIRDAIPSEVAGVATADLAWKRLLGTPRLGYHVDYSIAVLSSDEAERRIEFMSIWEPDAYCHFHQHLGPTASRIIAGELHVEEHGELLDVHKVRKSGHETANDGGDIHMEYAGPDGAVAYYDVRALEDGRLFDVLADDHRVLNTVTFDDFVAGRY